MNPSNTLLIATRNSGKFDELRSMLSTTGIGLVSLADFDDVPDPEECGSTFAENARIKARGYALACGVWTLADDSGLEVEALGGAPGVRSARYAGEGAGDRDRIGKLLGEMERAGAGSRRARFVCAVGVSDQGGNILFESEGECCGTIARSPIGMGGFGYDPIFVPDGFDCTFAELPPETKELISHRSMAIAKILPFLLGFGRSVA